MKFYIGSDSGSGQEFTSKEAFLHELALMIDDCEANGGTQFDVTVDADASCFYDPSDPDKYPDPEMQTNELVEFAKKLNDKRGSCQFGYWGTAEGEYGTGYYCKKKKQFVTGIECVNCVIKLI
jgi:hypothetical protein